MRIIGRWAAAIILGGVCAARAGTLHVSLLGDDGNDGLSWAAPLRTIQAAVAAARDQGHALVLVSNGIWSSTSSIVVTNAITVRAFSPDPAATTINGSGGRPVFWLGHPGAVADGFLIRDIYVANAGGALGAGAYITNGVLQNCVITNCHAYQGGGGVFMTGGLVSNCTLVANYSDTGGNTSPTGGNIHMTGGTVVACRITDSPKGYGVRMNGGLIDRCYVARNAMGYHNADGAYGAGIRAANASVIRNSVITGNYSTGGGGGIYMTGAGGVVENCTIVGNLAAADGGGIWANSLGTIRNCIVWGNQAGAGNKQNIRKAANTTLVNTLVTLSPGVTGTDTVDADPQFIDSGAGDYRLLPGSPAIDAGDNQTWQETALDYAGSLRRAGRVDLGAFEALAPDAGPFRVNFTNTLCRGATELEVVFTAHAAGADTNGLTYSWDFGGGHMSGAELRVVTNTFGPGIHSVALAVTNAAAAGAEMVRRAHVLVSPLDLYVSPGGGDILPHDRWSRATRDLRWAVDHAHAGDRVYIAGGDYPLMEPLIWQDAEGAVITGGYAGTAPEGPGACDPAQWPTVIRRAPERGHLRVMTLRNVVDGTLANVTIRDGFCERNYGRFPGAGIGIYDSSGLVISNCVVTNNMAVYSTVGDDLYMGGGGIYAENSSGLLTHCLVAGNHIQESWYDHVLKGGGMQIEGGDWRVASCAFIGNMNGKLSFGSRATVQGGGLYLAGAAARLDSRHTVVAHNMHLDVPSGKFGGGLYIAGGAASLTHVTLATNAVSGIHVQAGTAGATNSILWGHGADVVGGAALSFCCTGDDLPGTGNISEDPLFAAPPVDFHLQSKAGRWTPGGWVKDHAHSPCIDAGPRGVPVGPEPQPNGGRVNLGAYGGTSQASLHLARGALIMIR